MIKKDPEVLKKLSTILEKKSPKEKESLIFQPESFPYNLKNVFFGKKEYVLELGSGWGEFTRAFALQNPGTGIVAIEKKKKRILKSIESQRKEKINNIRWLLLDINWFFDEIFLPRQFTKIIINFPDPWPKKRHKKHRFLTPKLTNSIARLLLPQGKIEFATDFWPYLEETLTTLEARKDFTNLHGSGVILPKIPNRPTSFFENLKHLERENIYFLQYQFSPSK